MPVVTNSSRNIVRKPRERVRVEEVDDARWWRRPIATKFQSVTRAPPMRSASLPPSGRATEPTSAPRNARFIVTAGNCVLSSSGKAAE